MRFVAGFIRHALQNSAVMMRQTIHRTPDLSGIDEVSDVKTWS